MSLRVPSVVAAVAFAAGAFLNEGAKQAGYQGFSVASLSNVWPSSAKPDAFPHISSFSCDTPDLASMTKRQRNQYMLNSTVFVTKHPEAGKMVPMRMGFMHTMVPAPPQKGSGFIIDADQGYIVTNYHVAGEDADKGKVEITLYDPKERNGLGETIKAAFVGTDPDTDLTVLKIETTRPLTCVRFADSKTLDYGDTVIAVGHGFGLSFGMDDGKVSAPLRDIPKIAEGNVGTYVSFIQHNTPINMGNSGGPLFNTDVEVVGVNQGMIGKGGSAGVSFSIPSRMTVAVVNELILNGEMKQGWPGVDVKEADEDTLKALGLKRGLLVGVTKPYGPARLAGLQEKDVITHINDRELRDKLDFVRAVVHRDPGDVLQLGVRRGDETIQLSMTLQDKQVYEKAMAARQAAREHAALDYTLP